MLSAISARDILTANDILASDFLENSFNPGRLYDRISLNTALNIEIGTLF